MERFRRTFNFGRKLLVIMLNSLLILKVFLDGYSISYKNRELILKLILIAVPLLTLMVSVYYVFIRRKFIFITLSLLAAAFMLINLKFTLGQLPSQIALMNNLLSMGKQVGYNDIQVLIEWIIVFFVLVGFLSLYIYPFNLIIFDIIFIGFLWGVDYVKGLNRNFTYLLVLNAYLLLRHRYDIRNNQEMDIRKSKNYNKDSWRKYFQFISVSLVIILTTSLVFTEIKGQMYDRLHSFLLQKLANRETVADIRNSFDLSYVGYSDTERELGGNVSFREEPVVRMNVSSETIPRYIKGSTRTIFTNHSWSKSPSGFIYSSKADDRYILSLPKFTSSKQIATLSHINMRISSPLIPYYTTEVSYENNTVIASFYSEKDNQFGASTVISGSYDVVFFEPVNLEDYNLQNDKKIENIDQAYADYLQIPENFDQDIRKLAQDIVGEEELPFKKAILIRDYLQKNFNYTLTPEDKGVGDQFLTNFLFKSRQGYCVHYATAMTMLLRCVGVPSRYVEGFAISSKPANNGDIMIRDSEAHAWTEVLTDPENNIWTAIDATGTGQEYLDRVREEGQENTTTTASTSASQTSSSTKAQEENLITVESNPQGRIIFKVLLALLILGILIAIRMVYKRMKLQKMIEDSNTRELIDYIFELYRDSGTYISYTDTSLENARKINSPSASKDMQQLVRERYAREYGNKDIDSELKLREKVLNDAFNNFRHKNGKYKHFLRKYL